MQNRWSRVGSVFLALLLVPGCLGTVTTNQASADHAVHLENHGNESATFDITVVRNDTNETVHSQRYVLDPDAGRVVYNTNESSVISVVPFEIRWRVGNETGTMRIMTNRCYGDAYVVIRDDGTVMSTYAIC